MFSRLFPKLTLRSRFQLGKARGDWRLFLIPVFLALLGLLMIYEASSVLAIEVFNNRLYFFERQALWFAISVSAFLLVGRINHNYFKKFAPFLLVANVILLILVLIPGIGIEILGGRRWFDVGVFNFQPSELMKISLPLYLASLLSKPVDKYVVGLVILFIGGLIMLEPDMGTMLIIVGSACVVYFVSGIPKRTVLGFVGIGFIAVLALIVISPYRLTRLTTYLNPQADSLGSSYHLKQVLIALGNGGLFGQGLGMSKQKYLFIPEVTTDSIFAIIAEEIGLVGVVAVIVTYSYYLCICFSYLQKQKSSYSGLFGVGLVSSIAIQFFVNVGAISALVPLTGIPLPFISYGGTALVINFICAAIVYNISKHAA